MEQTYQMIFDKSYLNVGLLISNSKRGNRVRNVGKRGVHNIGGEYHAYHSQENSAPIP